MTEQEWLGNSGLDNFDYVWDWLKGVGLATPRKARLFETACCRRVWHLMKDDRIRDALEALEDAADVEEDAKAAGVISHIYDVNREYEGKAGSGTTVRIDGACWNTAVAVEELANSDFAEFPGSMEAIFRFIAAAELCSDGIRPRPDNGTQPAWARETLREIFGNPFRPVKLPVLRKKVPMGPFVIDVGTITEGFSNETYCPWLTPTVLAIASAVYKGRPGRDSEKCKMCCGTGLLWEADPVVKQRLSRKCHQCGGSGFRQDNNGTLDNAGLAQLSDALEDADCTDEGILRHLRGWMRCNTCQGKGVVRVDGERGESVDVCCQVCNPDAKKGVWGEFGPDRGWVKGCTHTRGCWALDLILGRV